MLELILRILHFIIVLGYMFKVQLANKAIDKDRGLNFFIINVIILLTMGMIF